MNKCNGFSRDKNLKGKKGFITICITQDSAWDPSYEGQTQQNQKDILTFMNSYGYR